MNLQTHFEVRHNTSLKRWHRSHLKNAHVAKILKSVL